MFWLPHSVEITTEGNMGVAEEVSQYSDYRLYYASELGWCISLKFGRAS